MNAFSIAAYPGDGIGPAVTTSAMRVVEAVQKRTPSFRLDWTILPWGAAYHEQHGSVVPDDYLQTLRAFDAILLGAVGWPPQLPDHVTLQPLIEIRQKFDLYACVRPARLMPGVRCPLAGKQPQDIDMLVIRENSEGEYLNVGGRVRQGTPYEFALQTAVHTRMGIERILRFGFDQARERRKHLTLVTKSNAQRYGFVLWDDVWDQIQGEYPEVQTEKQHVDAATMNFVRWPERFDVVVASNLFGDILTDLGGILAGGLGLAPSANIAPDRRHPSLFEPVHGSAPDIAGRGVANPVAAILSAAMMLQWLGQPDAAEWIHRAVARALSLGAATPDLGGVLTTQQMTDQIIDQLDAVRHGR